MYKVLISLTKGDDEIIDQEELEFSAESDAREAFEALAEYTQVGEEDEEPEVIDVPRIP
jgi:hypothetical protein